MPNKPAMMTAMPMVPRQNLVVEVVCHTGGDDEKKTAGGGKRGGQAPGGHKGDDPVRQLSHFRGGQHNDIPVWADQSLVPKDGAGIGAGGA
jgi:hypothetical protein